METELCFVKRVWNTVHDTWVADEFYLGWLIMALSVCHAQRTHMLDSSSHVRPDPYVDTADHRVLNGK